ncbi:MAG: disulfide oxidoreductase [Deinococcus sp.]
MTHENRLYLAWVVALTATLGSLYFSEVRGFLPCVLCWYQRTMMYPLVLVLGVAAFRNDLSARYTALPLAVIGWLVALYHVLEERGVVQTLKSCTVGVPCSTRWINVFGFITIPLLSLTAFTLILLLLAWRRERTVLAAA